jgi:hypothetical protein
LFWEPTNDLGSWVELNVLPGKYWAIVTADSEGASNWLTGKVEVNVDVTVADLSLHPIAK